MTNFYSKVRAGFGYKILERLGTQGFNFVISIILARILLPHDYGVVALVSVFMSMCDVFVTYGFGNSLIVDKDADEIDFSTCFYFGLGLSVLVYVVVYLTAPFIEKYFGYAELCSLVRIMGIRIPFTAINTVQNAYIARRLMFEKSFYATIIGSVVSGIVALVMVFNSFGILSLVAQYLCNTIISTCVMFVIVEWRPILKFSLVKLKKIYSYGWKILATGLIDTAYTQLRSIVIGKNYSSDNLAYYDKGNQFPSFSMSLIESTIDWVVFPSLARCSSMKQMKDLTKDFIKIVSYVIFPVMIGLFSVSDNLIICLLTERWIDASLFLQIGCVALVFRPLQVINACLIRATGNSGLLLKLDVIKKGVGVLALFIGTFYGIYGIALSFVFTNLFSTMINIFPNKTLIDYGYKEQVCDILDNLAISILMGVTVYTFGYYQPYSALIFTEQILLGMFSYILYSYIFANKNFETIKTWVCNMRTRNNAY